MPVYKKGSPELEKIFSTHKKVKGQEIYISPFEESPKCKAIAEEHLKDVDAANFGDYVECPMCNAVFQKQVNRRKFHNKSCKQLYTANKHLSNEEFDKKMEETFHKKYGTNIFLEDLPGYKYHHDDYEFED